MSERDTYQEPTMFTEYDAEEASIQAAEDAALAAEYQAEQEAEWEALKRAEYDAQQDYLARLYHDEGRFSNLD